jgi:hypothetical protein
MPSSQGSWVSPARIRFSIRRRYAADRGGCDLSHGDRRTRRERDGLARVIQLGLAMPEIPSCGSPWSQSLVKIDLASSFLWSRNRDFEHACALAREALEASAGRPVVSVQQRAAGFIRAATAIRGSAPRIAEIREIAGTLDTPRPSAALERLP